MHQEDYYYKDNNENNNEFQNLKHSSFLDSYSDSKSIINEAEINKNEPKTIKYQLQKILLNEDN